MLYIGRAVDTCTLRRAQRHTQRGVSSIAPVTRSRPGTFRHLHGHDGRAVSKTSREVGAALGEPRYSYWALWVEGTWTAII